MWIRVEKPPREGIPTFCRSSYKLMHRTEMTRGNKECCQIFQPKKTTPKWKSNGQRVTSNQPVTAVSQHSQLCSSELLRTRKVTLRGRFKPIISVAITRFFFFDRRLRSAGVTQCRREHAAQASPADDPEHGDVEPSGTEGAVTQQINGDTWSSDT